MLSWTLRDRSYSRSREWDHPDPGVTSSKATQENKTEAFTSSEPAFNFINTKAPDSDGQRPLLFNEPYQHPEM